MGKSGEILGKRPGWESGERPELVTGTVITESVAKFCDKNVLSVQFRCFCQFPIGKDSLIDVSPCKY